MTLLIWGRPYGSVFCLCNCCSVQVGQMKSGRKIGKIYFAGSTLYVSRLKVGCEAVWQKKKNYNTMMLLYGNDSDSHEVNQA
jgi:hypothetical protein